MTQEEKAKAYDEALERAKNLYNCDKTSADVEIACENIFPELKESEDERIRKELIDFVKSRLAGFPECGRFIAWLKKQDVFSKKDVDDAYLKGITDAKNEIEKQYGIIFPTKLKEDELTWLTRYIEEEVYSLSMDIRDDKDRIKLKNLKKSLDWLEKQGKSALEAINEEKVDNQNCVKSTDKVEPKFKVGDKIVHKVNKESPFTITEITKDCYKGGTQYEILFEQQDNFELVPDKFDINTLKPFESRVLVRLTKDNVWNAAFFSHYDKEVKWGCYPFVTTGSKSYLMCIPFEGNEHLLGTTNDCNDYYKTWE